MGPGDHLGLTKSLPEFQRCGLRCISMAQASVRHVFDSSRPSDRVPVRTPRDRCALGETSATIPALGRPQQPVAIYLDAVTRGRELEACAGVKLSI